MSDYTMAGQWHITVWYNGKQLNAGDGYNVEINGHDDPWHSIDGYDWGSLPGIKMIAERFVPTQYEDPETGKTVFCFLRECVVRTWTECESTHAHEFTCDLCGDAGGYWTEERR